MPNEPSSWKRHRPIKKRWPFGWPFVCSKDFGAPRIFQAEGKISLHIFLSYLQLMNDAQADVKAFFTFVHLFIIIFRGHNFIFPDKKSPSPVWPGNVQFDNKTFTFPARLYILLLPHLTCLKFSNKIRKFDNQKLFARSLINWINKISTFD